MWKRLKKFLNVMFLAGLKPAYTNSYIQKNKIDFFIFYFNSSRVS